eukprot:TRINITY_DN12498_c0_g6_i1.p3 TRINITY_DN12498_c0_g6~~TRINITY_DN12498_c0_g6_i1.p3  ORF type:complete len:141 (-),score=9.62 TRINITY_DN12498_c0_g6_i1:528-950(-)
MRVVPNNNKHNAHQDWGDDLNRDIRTKSLKERDRHNDNRDECDQPAAELHQHTLVLILWFSPPYFLVETLQIMFMRQRKIGRPNTTRAFGAQLSGLPAKSKWIAIISGSRSYSTTPSTIGRRQITDVMIRVFINFHFVPL